MSTPGEIQGEIVYDTKINSKYSTNNIIIIISIMISEHSEFIVILALLTNTKIRSASSNITSTYIGNSLGPLSYLPIFVLALGVKIAETNL